MVRHVLVAGCLLIGGVVSAGTPDPQELADRIDARIDARLKAAKVVPAAVADDAEFLRRAYLDITGRIPAPRDVYDFLADNDPNKRARRIDELLESPRYASHFAAIWRALLLPEASANIEARVFQPGFEAWLRQRLRANTAYDRMVRELIATPITPDVQAPDPVLRDPLQPNPLAFYAVKEAKPENLAAATARVFLGVRIECAQCHDHPFGRWERKQFWNLAAFFAGVSREGDGLFAPVSDTGRRELAMPNTTRTMRAAFLNGREFAGAQADRPRQALADWITARDNPFFARAGANRIWGQLFGIGLVDPVDDFNDQNPPSHPELLDELAAAFADAKFDVRFLIRALGRTRAYQRTSARGDAPQSDARLFARMPVKGLSGEQLFDSLVLATGYREPPGRERNAVQERFLADFAPQGRPTEPETSITRALTLMNGRLLNRLTDPRQGATLMAVCESPGMVPADRIEALYVAALSRRPSANERERMVRFLAEAGSDRQADRLADVFWVLLNSAEFRLNH